MRGFRADIDESRKGNISDITLFKKLLYYLKPYKLYAFFSLFMLLLLTAVELLLPIVTKNAVDECIVPNKTVLILDSKRYAEFDEKHDIDLETYEKDENYYLILPNKKRNHFEKKELDEMREEGVLPETNYFFLDKDKEIMTKLSSNNYIDLGNGKLAISEQALDSLEVSKKDFVKTKLIDRVKQFGLFFLILTVIQFFTTFLEIYSMNYAAQNAMRDLRIRTFAHIEKMPISFFDKNPIGRLVTRVTNDIRTLDELLSNGVITIIQDFSILIGIFVTLLIIAW